MQGHTVRYGERVNYRSQEKRSMENWSYIQSCPVRNPYQRENHENTINWTLFAFIVLMESITSASSFIDNTAHN